MRFGRKTLKQALEPLTDRHADEMIARMEEALDATERKSNEATMHAKEAQQLFGAIRREIAVVRLQDNGQAH